ncbi:MAG TPA: SpoIIE family protein phosphatase [Thermoanaerobaculia bacterium]|nr:SpoIIE family protein phosphatase [Thermoanaerobaculia bacterium]HQR68480.1 SpoIIE family protein phosphatase [Thermoanaerobaculia bacterium]
MPVLKVKTGSLAGRAFDIRKDAEVGRTSLVDVELADPSVSRRHASLARRGESWILTDLGSQNGTAVNGKRLREPVALHDGDEVRFGAVVLDFRNPPEAGPKRPTSDVSLTDLSQTVLQSLKASSTVDALLSGGAAAPDLARRLQLVYDVGTVLSRTLDEEPLLSRVLDELFAVFPKADYGFILLVDASTGEVTPAAVRSRSGGAPPAMSRTIVQDVVRNRRGVLSVDALIDERFPQAESIQILGIRSLVCVPMQAHDEIPGVITLYSNAATQSFDRDDMALLLAIASQAGLALSRARLHARSLKQELLEQDLALARRIQARFLPKGSPEVRGWAFCDHYAPALEVGGDYFDFLELPRPFLGIAIGDVSGKGVSAALVMAKLGSEVRYHSVGRTDPAEILGRVNRVLSEDLEDGVFVTASLLVVNTESGEVRMASAGHPPPLVRRASGAVTPLAAGARLPLGVADSTVFPAASFALGPGDVAVLYTDGITEAADRSGALLGEERMKATVAAARGTPEAVRTALLDAVSRFAGDEPPSDDITLVCFGPTRR